MQKTDELVNTLVKAVNDIQNKKAKGYDTQAKVTRVEGSTAYVHIPGGVDETPAQLTINANKGDTVRVRVAGGTAWLVGNATNPPTDDATANAASIVANTANAMASEAIESANIAAEAADSAKASAHEAEISANMAGYQAKVANQQAGYATTSANNALIQLSTVESVVDTLNWLAAHSDFIQTSDQSRQAGKIYYEQHKNLLDSDSWEEETISGVTFSIDGGTIHTQGTATADVDYELGMPVGVGTSARKMFINGCPSGGSATTYFIGQSLGGPNWNRDTGDGVESTAWVTIIRIIIKAGTNVDGLTWIPMVKLNEDAYENYIEYGDTSGEWYVVDFDKVGWSAPGSVSPSTLLMYELNTSDAVKTYVQSHLALTNDGLYVLMDNSGYKVKIDNYGMYIQAPNGQTVNQTTADGNIIKSENGDAIAHLGYGEGASTSGTANAPYYTLGSRADNSIVGNYSLAQGLNNTASGYSTQTSGEGCAASNRDAHAEGRNCTASGYWSHAEGGGGDPGATGSTASGTASHAEGEHTTASSEAAHSEGVDTTAGGVASHAEGNGTEASANQAHAGGLGTIAQRADQTVIGTYNEADTGTPAPTTGKGTYAFIIGKGQSDSARSNALTVDWSGNVTSAGKMTVGTAPSNNMDVSTKKYVDDKASDYLPLTGGSITGNLSVSGTFNGFVIAGASGTRWNLIPVVNASGVLEAGKYIDFHETGTGSEDYTARLNCSSAGTLIASGAVQATNYYVGSHTTAIGSQVRAGLGTSKSLTANTWTELFSFSLPAGTWLVIAGFRCPSSASGLRYANIEKTSKNTSQNASFTPSGNGVNSFVFTKSITVTAATTFYYNVMSTVATSASTGSIDSNGAGYGTFYQAIRLL